MKTYLLFFSLLLFVACSTQTPTIIDKIEELDISINPQVETIFVLTDSNCIPCNIKFSQKLISEEIDNPKSLIILNTNGLAYDISDFKNRKNVYKIQSYDQVFKDSKIIHIKNREITDEIIITAKNINSIEF